LDYVFTDEENLIESINYDPPIGKSDHVMSDMEYDTGSRPVDKSDDKQDQD